MRKLFNTVTIVLIILLSWYLFIYAPGQPKSPDELLVEEAYEFGDLVLPGTPVQQTPVSSVKIAVIGDFGDPSPSPADQVADLIKGWGVDAIVTTGDNAYPSGTLVDLDNSLARYQEYVTNCRFYPTLGNHDWGYPDINSYSAETLPSSVIFAHCLNGQRYYSSVLGRGLVKIIILDTDRREPDLELQGSFLQRELSSGEPYKFVFTHEPPYASCEGKSSNWSKFPYRDWNLYPSAVFSGHCHLYEHLNINGVHYVISGAGGGGQTDQFNTYQDGSLVQYNDQKGAVMIEVTAETATISFVAIDGSVIDVFTLPPLQ